MLQVDLKEVVKETIRAELMLVGRFFVLLTALACVKGMLSNRVNDGWRPPDSWPPLPHPRAQCIVCKHSITDTVALKCRRIGTQGVRANYAFASIQAV